MKIQLVGLICSQEYTPNYITKLGSFSFVPPVRYAPPVTEHVSLHSNQLFENTSWKKYASTKLGAQTEKIRKLNFTGRNLNY